MSESPEAQLLIEYAASNGYEPHIKGVPVQHLQEQITSLTSLVQQLAPDPHLATDQNLVLDEITVSIKINPDGQVILPTNGITLHYRPPFQLPPQLGTAGLNVTRLQQLLKEQKWQEANLETWNLMCRALNKPEGLPLTTQDIQQLPCQTLQLIDQLWKKASNGRFGFGIQRRRHKAQTQGN
jgi:hypothetical protein